MSGILDGKARVLDTVVTQVGKRQLAQGGLDVRYVSFSDSTTFYKKDLESPNFLPFAENPIGRIQFEACNLPQDQISFDLNEEGKIDASVFGVLNGVFNSDEIFEGVTEQSSSVNLEALFKNPQENFKKLQIIGTSDSLFDDDGFEIKWDSSKIEFFSRVPTPIRNRADNKLVEIFRDKKFSNSLKYKFLPPISKTDDNTVDKSDFESFKEFQIAQYEPWGLIGGKNKLKVEEIFSDLLPFVRGNFFKKIEISESSRKNNLFLQFFEVSNSSVENLFFVDFGVHKTPEGLIKRSLALGPDVQIIFAGKLHKKESGSYSFIRLFTLICG
jgi:hypothetical protein